MRLSTEQVEIIKQTASEAFGDDVRVWLFGSRLDDSRRGGDIDLLIEAPGRDSRELARARIRFLARLKLKLGDRRIDVIASSGQTPVPHIVKIARQTGTPL
ncbi:nucleotidyltransferase domain-containing protein [Wenzhouxiangella sp. AB-CW3]|uniref:nucleotidyltransferase domain-containing protein n=1 Tax=Wenzhouxiangella sp. AB-CW3 TaxID=2771012 RepID=UPI00168BF07E|nr:nucleotidyltransferase domain-containing protein [Wenzhouxiangella sp. AB-CW3]QOC23763.1 nucleotidyltransferase domain-containing protein [Wenzhouxiangella sp. AB-CW3]